MDKLTSKDIQWGDDQHIAVVDKFNYITLYPAQDVSMANKRFYVGSDWYLMDEHYIVYRKSEPVNKSSTVIEIKGEGYPDIKPIDTRKEEIERDTIAYIILDSAEEGDSARETATKIQRFLS